MFKNFLIAWWKSAEEDEKKESLTFRGHQLNIMYSDLDWKYSVNSKVSNFVLIYNYILIDQ